MAGEFDDSTDNIDDVTGGDGATEVFELLKEYLSQPGSQSETRLRERLASLGVSSLSHIPMLAENDLTDIIAPIQFRIMQSKIKTNNLSFSKEKESSSDMKSSSYKVDLKSLLSNSFFKLLETNHEILSPQDRRKLIILLADDIRETVCVVRKKDILSVSMAVVKAYPTSLGCLMKDDADITEAAAALCNSILSHIFYVNSQLKAKRPSNSEAGPSKRHRFSKSQSNGLDPERDCPNSLPDEETLETQEAKRLLMVEMDKSGMPLNWNVIKKLMAETYCSQRMDINEQLSMEQLLARWPFIGKHAVLQAHFETLKNIYVAEVMQEVEVLFPNLEKFFEAEAHKKRKGKSAAIPKRLKELLLKYQQQGDENKESKHFICIILCAMVFMDVPQGEVFLLFEETTSFNEVQTSPNLPSHPIIAVLGDDPQENPKAYVLVDKRIISEATVSVTKAINIVLMCYYVFKIEFPTRSAPILHFLQRKVFNITDEGSKTERRKSKKGYIGAPPAIPNMMIRLMKNFKEYCSVWNIS